MLNLLQLNAGGARAHLRMLNPLQLNAGKGTEAPHARPPATECREEHGNTFTCMLDILPLVQEGAQAQSLIYL